MLSIPILHGFLYFITAEEKASGISPDEPSELDESAPTFSCHKDKDEKADRAKAEDERMKAMERLVQTKKGPQRKRVRSSTNQNEHEEKLKMPWSI